MILSRESSDQSGERVKRGTVLTPSEVVRTLHDREILGPGILSLFHVMCNHGFNTLVQPCTLVVLFRMECLTQSLLTRKK